MLESTKKDLDDYLHRLEEAEKRDHQKTRQRNGPYFISEKKVQVQYFGMRKDGHLFQRLD